MRDSNSRPFRCKRTALPTELIARLLKMQGLSYLTFKIIQDNETNLADPHRGPAYRIVNFFVCVTYLSAVDDTYPSTDRFRCERFAERTFFLHAVPDILDYRPLMYPFLLSLILLYIRTLFFGKVYYCVW